MSTIQPIIYVVANNIRSLYNVGALFRLCDGVGVTKLFLTGLTGTPADTLRNQRQRQQIAKTALEGLNSVDWEYRESATELLNELRQQGVRLVALEQTEHSQMYTEANYTFPLCLILGHEADGVDQSILDIVDLAVELPMRGQGKSLNVISAASVALYHIQDRLDNSQ